MDIIPRTKTKLNSNYFTHSEVQLRMYLKAMTIRARDVDFSIGDFDVLPDIFKSTAFTIVSFMDLTKIPKEQHL